MSERVWTSEFQGAFDHVRYLVGDELLAFLTGTPQPHANDHRTARTARKLAANLDLLEREDPRLPVALVRSRQADGLPMAWSVRQANGGNVPAPQGSGDLELALTRIARDVYPVLLGPSDEMIVAGPGLRLPAADATIALDQLVTSHPECQQAISLLDTTSLPQSELVAASAFSIDRLSEAATPPAILAAAARRLRHTEHPDATRFMELVIDNLDQLRALADGRQIEMPAYIGFSALPMPVDHNVTLPHGTLRAATKSERRIVPFSFQADAVLSTSVMCQTFEAGQDTTAPQGDGQNVLNRQAREVILAAALSSDQAAPYWCPSVAWVISQGLGHGTSSYRPLHPARPSGRAEPVSVDELEALKLWVERVGRADLAHVDIAVDRTLRAIWEGDSIDSLIDAVIAWENLVGTRTETAYRVTAALTVLCEDDPHQRVATRKKLTLVYDARSRLVHGDPPPAGVQDHRNLAVRIALEALRRLMTERRDLLALSSSSKRAERLLLGIATTET